MNKQIEELAEDLTETKAQGYKVENGKLIFFSNMLNGYIHEYKDLQEICEEMNGVLEKCDSYIAQIEFWKSEAEVYRLWKNKLVEENAKIDNTNTELQELNAKYYNEAKDLKRELEKEQINNLNCDTELQYKEKRIAELEKENARLLNSVETVQSNRCTTKCELTKKELKQFAERLKEKFYYVFGNEYEQSVSGFDTKVIIEYIDETLKECINE